MYPYCTPVSAPYFLHAPLCTPNTVIGAGASNLNNLQKINVELIASKESFGLALRNASESIFLTGIPSVALTIISLMASHFGTRTNSPNCIHCYFNIATPAGHTGTLA